LPFSVRKRSQVNVTSSAMGVEVGRIVAPGAENSPALGLRPERAGRQQRLGGHHRAGGGAGLQEVATVQPREWLRMA